MVFEARGGDGPTPARGRDADAERAAGPWWPPGGCRGNCAPTRTGTASSRPGNPTRVSWPRSTGGPPPVTSPRRWPPGCHRKRHAAAGGRFRAVVPPGAGPAGPGAQRRTGKLACAPRRNAPTTSGAASSLLMAGRVMQTLRCHRRIATRSRRDDERTAGIRPQPWQAQQPASGQDQPAPSSSSLRPRRRPGSSPRVRSSRRPRPGSRHPLTSPPGAAALGFGAAGLAAARLPAAVSAVRPAAGAARVSARAAVWRADGGQPAAYGQPGQYGQPPQYGQYPQQPGQYPPVPVSSRASPVSRVSTRNGQPA